MNITEEIITAGTAGIEMREMTADTSDQHEVVGLAMPYGVSVDLPNGSRERFEPGAFADSLAPGATLRSYTHGAAIGRVTELIEKPDGLYYRAMISKTVAGEEAYLLLRDGVLHSASVGFFPAEGGSHVDHDGTIVRTRAKLMHISLTGEPIYGTAKVLAHRAFDTPDHGDQPVPDAPPIDGPTVAAIPEGDDMPDLAEISAEMAEMRIVNEDFQRSLDAIRSNTAPAAPEVGAQYRSAGEWIKAVANGEESALQLCQRDFSLSSQVGIQPAFLGATIRLVDQGRVSLSAFSRGPLPASGMSVEYVELDTDSTQVARQAAEGDQLAYGEVSLVVRSASIDTYGGWSALSRQAVERSQVNVVDVAYRAMVAKYAAVTNAAFATYIAANATTAQPLGASLAAGMTEDWDAAVIAAEIDMASSGINLPAEFVLVSANVYMALKSLRVSDNPYLANVGAQTPSVGSINPLTLRGVINGLPLLVDPTLANGTAYVANSGAFETLEAGGPTKLADEDITRLTKQYSVYSYLAFTKPAAIAGIRKITFGA